MNNRRISNFGAHTRDRENLVWGQLEHGLMLFDHGRAGTTAIRSKKKKRVKRKKKKERYGESKREKTENAVRECKQ